ncbi:MAG: citrate synthase [Bacteriovoracales bacterium]|nr:citrate synthase [Bacteriovoracales bacterium]
MGADKAKIVVGDQTYEVDIVTGTEGEKALDIGSLRGRSGLVTLDNGFGNTGSCRSSVTFLNGEKGVLKYRGIPIEELAQKSHFLEVAFLLIEGALPSREELDDFAQRIAKNSHLPEPFKKMMASFPQKMHPMGALSCGTVALSAFFPEGNPPDPSAEQRAKAITLLLGQMKAMIATYYRLRVGKELRDSDPGFDYSSDFFQMMFGEGDRDVDPEVAKALDTLLILHGDHEQNCSTSSVRMVGSGKANLFSSVASGINALWGPLHGGANEAVIDMLDEILADGGGYKKFLAKAKDKSDPFRLMGFGHRVYKNFDPRAKIIKGACDTVLSKLGVHDPVLDIAKGLEEEALKDDYFMERKLYPNVDFYSGIIYRALGIPTDFFTPMFVLGRLPGWLAQWKELREDPKMRIGRPRQIYMGKTDEAYVEMGVRPPKSEGP